jgi:hypothetical protein
MAKMLDELPTQFNEATTRPWNVATLAMRLYHNPHAGGPWTPASIGRMP